MQWRHLSKKLASFMAGVIALTAFFGIFVCVGMNMDVPTHQHESHAMNTPNCNDTSGTENCQMGVLEHITTWEKTFLGFLGMDMTRLLIITVVSTFFLVISSILPRELIFQKTKKYLFYIRSHPERLLYQNLVSAYSNGIIQPKILA